MIARSTLLGLSWGMFSIAPVSSTWLPPQLLPVYGGSGGTAFTRTCGSGKVLTGLRFRDGIRVDAVGILCRPVFSDGTLGPQSTVGTLVGGPGGTSGTANCPSGTVMTRAIIHHGSVVDRIFPVCKSWDAGKRKFGGTAQFADDGVGGGAGTENMEQCEAATQPMSGIRGRAGLLVDAIGFTCNEP